MSREQLPPPLPPETRTVGQLVAEIIGGEEPGIDVTALRPSRFREGAAIEAPELL